MLDVITGRPFIQALAQRNVITGFADGTFDEPVDRAEFAAMIQKLLTRNQFESTVGTFTDVPPDYWAASAIEEAYETGFMGGYPGTLFRQIRKFLRFRQSLL